MDDKKPIKETIQSLFDLEFSEKEAVEKLREDAYSEDDILKELYNFYPVFKISDIRKKSNFIFTFIVSFLLSLCLAALYYYECLDDGHHYFVILLMPLFVLYFLYKLEKWAVLFWLVTVMVLMAYIIFVFLFIGLDSKGMGKLYFSILLLLSAATRNLLIIKQKVANYNYQKGFIKSTIMQN